MIPSITELRAEQAEQLRRAEESWLNSGPRRAFTVSGSTKTGFRALLSERGRPVAKGEGTSVPDALAHAFMTIVHREFVDV